MKVLDKHAGENLIDYYIAEGRKAIKKINSEMDAVTELKSWLLLKERLLEGYKKAYPEYMFKERSPVKSKLVSAHEFTHYRIENHLFESYPGWFVNATVYLPKEKGVYPGIVCPTGHSAKIFENYTGPAQLLARSGYVVVSFDPPGMRGEHQEGNDHFEDGVRSYLSGFWSQTFFVMDAIRCMDYLETREDVEQGIGFAMTGISGGGTTTLHTAILDDRLSCMAPVCCVSDEDGLMFKERYTFCPEGRGYGHIKNGINYRSLLSMGAPVPLLLVAGRNDEVLDYRLAKRNIEKAKKIYGLFGNIDADIFVDDEAGHEYTPKMVNRVLDFIDLHMKGICSYEGTYEYTYDDIEYPEAEKLLCHPKDTSSIASVNKKMFSKYAERTVPYHNNLADWLGVEKDVMPKSVQTVFKTEKLWAHRLFGIKFNMNKFVKIPGLLLKRENGYSRDIVIYADDKNKWVKLENEGFLAKKAAILSRKTADGEKTVLSVDLSGFGELLMEPGAFDIAPWCRTDRLFSYIAIALGTSITAQRTMEFLAVLNSIKESGQYDSITCAGKGLASIPVLYASFIFGNCSKVVLENIPVSYSSMSETVPNIFLPTSVVYNASKDIEIYNIANELKNLVLINPVNADMTKINEIEAREIYNENVELIFNDVGLKAEYL